MGMKVFSQIMMHQMMYEIKLFSYSRKLAISYFLCIVLLFF